MKSRWHNLACDSLEPDDIVSGPRQKAALIDAHTTLAILIRTSAAAGDSTAAAPYQIRPGFQSFFQAWVHAGFDVCDGTAFR